MRGDNETGVKKGGEMKKVIIEVQGGVAHVTSCPDDVKVEIIDHDEGNDE